MSVPIFDHSKEASAGIDGRVRFLMQDGVRFSYAEYNRHEKKFKPEPRYIPEGIITRDDMRGRLDDFIFRLVESERTMRELRGHIASNLDQFIEREQDYWAVERSKYENQIAKLESKLKEIEDLYYEEQVKHAKLEDEHNTALAQLKVYDATIKKFKEDGEQSRRGRANTKTS